MPQESDVVLTPFKCLLKWSQETAKLRLRAYVDAIRSFVVLQLPASQRIFSWLLPASLWASSRHLSLELSTRWPTWIGFLSRRLSLCSKVRKNTCEHSSNTTADCKQSYALLAWGLAKTILSSKFFDVLASLSRKSWRQTSEGPEIQVRKLVLLAIVTSVLFDCNKKGYFVILYTCRGTASEAMTNLCKVWVRRCHKSRY